MSVRVHIERIVVDGWTPPHDFELTIKGRIDEQVDDEIVRVMHDHGNEFRDAIGPTIAEVFERVFLSRLGRRADAAAGLKLIGMDFAPGPAEIEDIEL